MIPRAHITAWRASVPWSVAEFEANLAAKLSDPGFLEDVAPLLAPGSPWDMEDAAGCARAELLVRLSGDTWRGEAQETEQEE